MTIQELADRHVGQSEELDEDPIITAQRESYEWGALAILGEIMGVLYHCPPNELRVKLEEKIIELAGEL